MTALTDLGGRQRRRTGIAVALAAATLAAPALPVPARAGSNSSRPAKGRAAAQQAMSTAIRAIVVYHDLNAARGYLLAAAAADPGYDLPGFNLGLVAEMQERWGEAAQRFQQYLKTGNDAAAVAEAKAALQRIAAAKEADATPQGLTARRYREAITRGRLLAGLGQRKAALAEAAAAEALDAGRPEAYVLSAAICARGGEFDLAGEFLGKALTAAPEPARGELQALQARMATEGQLYQRRKEIAPMLRAKEFPAAVAALQKLVDQFPDRPELRLELASTQAMAGSGRDARQTLVQLPAAAPGPVKRQAQALLARLDAADAFVAAMKDPNLQNPDIDDLQTRIERLQQGLGLTRKLAETDEEFARNMEVQYNTYRSNAATSGSAGIAGLASILAGAEARRKREKAERQMHEIQDLLQQKIRLSHEPKALAAARKLERDGSMLAATFAYAVLIEQRPDERRYRAQYGELLMQLGEDTRAETMLASAPGEPGAIPLLLVLEDRMGRHRAAAALYDRSEKDLRAARDQKDEKTLARLPPAFAAAGRSFVRLGELRRAEAALRAGTEAAPDPALRFALGRVLALEQRPKDAAKQMEAAIKEREKQAAEAAKSGNDPAPAKSGEPGEASSTVAPRPGAPGLWYAELAAQYVKLDKKKEASKTAQTALQAGLTAHPVFDLLDLRPR